MIVANSSALNVFPHLSLTNLLISESDHGPIYLSFNSNVTRKAKAFKFKAMWISHPDFSNIVNRTWLTAGLDDATKDFVSKTNAFQAQAKSWNFNVFGNPFHRLRDLHSQLQAIQSNPCYPLDTTLLLQETNLMSQTIKMK